MRRGTGEKLKVSAKKLTANRVERVPIEQDLGVEIEFEGQTFAIGVDNHGRLYVRSTDISPLVIRPESANTVLIATK